MRKPVGSNVSDGFVSLLVEKIVARTRKKIKTWKS